MAFKLIKQQHQMYVYRKKKKKNTSTENIVGIGDIKKQVFFYSHFEILNVFFIFYKNSVGPSWTLCLIYTVTTAPSKGNPIDHKHS